MIHLLNFVPTTWLTGFPFFRLLSLFFLQWPNYTPNARRKRYGDDGTIELFMSHRYKSSTAIVPSMHPGIVLWKVQPPSYNLLDDPHEFLKHLLQTVNPNCVTHGAEMTMGAPPWNPPWLLFSITEPHVGGNHAHPGGLLTATVRKHLFLRFGGEQIPVQCEVPQLCLFP